jgi:Argininosuccinate synthase
MKMHIHHFLFLHSMNTWLKDIQEFCWIRGFLWRTKHCIIFQANIGQEEDFEVARKKALKIGASKVRYSVTLKLRSG